MPDSIKKRFSFKTPDNLFRIDLTAVKSGGGTSFMIGFNEVKNGWGMIGFYKGIEAKLV